MINTYSYRITREEASETKIKDEEIFDQKSNKKLLNDFLECWDNIKTYIQKNTNEEKEEKTFTEENFLVCFLNDSRFNSENYIYKGYQYFINLQN